MTIKILHLCLCAPVTDGWAYQDNLLPKYHKFMGFDVTIVTSKWFWNSVGKLKIYDREEYENEDGVKIIRLPMKGNENFNNRFKRFQNLDVTLETVSPDILFIHGCQFLDMDCIAGYLKKHPNVRVYVDNHADFGNSAKNWFSRIILHKIIWRHCAHKIEPYTTKFYGVLPARVDFLKDVYKLPPEKCELLVLGADDEIVKKVKTMNCRKIVREEYAIGEDDVLVVTGGKINRSRPEVLNLMEAVISLDNSKIKLLVFGNVEEKYKEKFDKLCESDKIIYVGWLKSADTYNYFEAADLVVFPGLHSVMWEQAVAQGKACVFRDIDGFHHVDVGGNALFVKDVSADGLEKVISELVDDKDKLKKMRSVAEERGMTVFSYADIARRSINAE